MVSNGRRALSRVNIRSVNSSEVRGTGGLILYRVTIITVKVLINILGKTDGF